MDNQRLEKCNALQRRIMALEADIKDFDSITVESLRESRKGFNLCNLSEVEALKRTMIECGSARLAALKLEFNSL